MDNSSLCCTSVSEGENACDTNDKLCTGLSDKLQINGGNSTNDKHERPVKGNYIEDEEEDEDGDEDDFSEEAMLAQMGYVKSEPKMVSTKAPQEQYHEEEEDEEDDLSKESILAQMGYLKDEPPKHEPITTPTAALSLVSAFKGSRSREDKPAKNCRVSWAPDVYDPPPTSDDHFTESKTDRHKVKGVAGKNRQKSSGKGLVGPSEIRVGGGKGSKGGGNKEAGKGKDKKQVKKRGGGGGSKYGNYGEE